MTENIKLAIFGPVSAGKTTFNNALMSNKCSGMARKKLTMLPQIYQIVNDDAQIDTIEEIYQKNKSSNETILKLREDGTFDQEQHFTELIHNIHSIPDFIQLPDTNATYSILDMPGLNCAGDTLYYYYVQKISSTIDIYLIVFDINSGLNTTDEINILKFLVAQIQQNNHGYLHILINKCDNITINGDNITLADEELDELYKRIIEAINKYCTPIHDKVSISPLCSQKLYIYRSVKNDITTIEEAHLNDIILDELGKKGLKDFPHITAKREYVSELMDLSFNDWIKNTGYNQFIHSLDKILRNYSELVFYHINADLVKLQDIWSDLMNDDNNFDTFDIISKKIRKINMRIQKVMQYYDKTIPQYLLDNLEIINVRLNDYLIAAIYSESPINTIDTIINKINDYYKMLKNLFNKNPLKAAKIKLSNYREQLLIEEFEEEFNNEIFTELFDDDGTGYTQVDDNGSDIMIQDTNIIYELYKKSIHNTLSKDMNKVICIFDFLSSFNFPELLYNHNRSDFYYKNLLIMTFVDLLATKKIKEDIFLEFLPKLITNRDAHDDNDILVLASKAITNFMITQYKYGEEAIYIKIICTYWTKLNSSKIGQSSREIQYIYLISRTFNTYNSVDSIFEKVDYETYNSIMNILDSIFEVLKCYFVDINV